MLLFFKYLISVLALVILVLPSDISSIIRLFAEGSIIAIIVAVLCSYSKLKWPYIHKKLVIYDVFVISVIMGDFVRRWIVSGKMTILAGRFHLPTETFLLLSSTILAAAAITSIDGFFYCMFLLFEKVGSNFRSRSISFVSNIACILAVLVLEHFQLNYSVICSLERMGWQNRKYVLLGFLLLILCNLIISLVICSWKITLAATSFIISLWSIANYYVIKFHGSPLFISEFVNARTALNVAGGYKYTVNLTVFILFISAVAELSIVFGIYKKEKVGFINHLVSHIALIMLAGIMVFTQKELLFPEGIAHLSWNDAVSRHGFEICVLRDCVLGSQSFIIPDGYDVNDLKYDVAEPVEIIKDLPDIIVILNETFCDLETITEIDADCDYLKDFYSIEGAHYCKAVAPGIGGGTNNAEFELLTSKSMYLLTATAPFNWMSRNLEARSIVQYLKTLGYSTTGMHCGGSMNYNRDKAYPALGFDHIVLGPDAFSYISYNGERSWLDSDNYKDLSDHYHENGVPSFMYLLTLQNHGGFEKNEASLDTVHTNKDFGDLTDDINEFLSTVRLSADAFVELTEYYSKVDRPVIICMVGDHAPSFISELPANTETSQQLGEDIAKRLVPLVMWSNYGVDFSLSSEYISMIDIIPVILKSAGLPLSDYYQTVYNLYETLPIRTSTGQYVDQTGVGGIYSIDSPYYKMLNKYYCLEYNSLMKDQEYREEFFEPKFVP